MKNSLLTGAWDHITFDKNASARVWDRLMQTAQESDGHKNENKARGGSVRKKLWTIPIAAILILSMTTAVLGATVSEINRLIEKISPDVAYFLMKERTQTEQVIWAIPFETIEIIDDSLDADYLKVETEGTPGKALVTLEVTYREGEKISEREISREVIEAPTDRVIIKGTGNEVDIDDDDNGDNDLVDGNSEQTYDLSRPDPAVLRVSEALRVNILNQSGPYNNISDNSFSGAAANGGMAATCLVLPVDVTVDNPDFTRTATVGVDYSTEVLLNSIPAGQYRMYFTWSATAVLHMATANDGAVQLQNPSGTMTLGASAVGSGTPAKIDIEQNLSWKNTSDAALMPYRWDLLNYSNRTETFSMIITVGADGTLRLAVDARLYLTAIQTADGAGSVRVSPVYLTDTFEISSIKLVLLGANNGG